MFSHGLYRKVVTSSPRSNWLVYRLFILSNTPTDPVRPQWIREIISCLILKLLELRPMAGRILFFWPEFPLKPEGIMYCPNCGQAQTSEEIRYCSRCGLSLWELARWLTGGANAPGNPIQQRAELSARKKRIRQGAKLMFLGGVLFPVCFGLALLVDEAGPLLLPLTIFFAGLAWALYSRLFVDDMPELSTKAPVQLYRPSEYLPPAQVNPAPVLRAMEPNTAEIVRPPSVTEYTTNLLRNRDKS